MRTIFVVLPHQLYEINRYLQDVDIVYLIEDPYYFKPTFHKQKLCLHRVTMQYYKDYLTKVHSIKIKYISHHECSYTFFKSMEDTKIYMFHPIDKKSVTHWKFKHTTFYDPPNFITTMSDLKEYKQQIGERTRYTQSHFYIWQRKRLQILVDEHEQPLMGKWSFDAENRNKFNVSYQEPVLYTFSNKYTKEAIQYIRTYFPNAFGELTEFYYPITHKECKVHVKRFIQQKLNNFGDTQDAISKHIVVGHHSLLSSSLNIGLITPTYVIQKVLQAFNKVSDPKKCVASVEGFIRQLIGWREYMRFIYLFHHKDIIDTSYMEMRSTMPKSWYTGNTNLYILNHYINKTKKYAYLHHIERLMIMNNIAMLYDIQYKYIYKWFMTCFIDSYDWVMVPNVLMNYNSLGPVTFMTRVYIGSDNYIKKMSDFRYQDDFKYIHSLYWSFLKRHKKILAKDYGVAPQLKRLTL